MNVSTWHQDNTPSCWEGVLERLRNFETQVHQIKKAKKSSQVPMQTPETFYELHNALITETDKVWRTSIDTKSTDSISNVLDNTFVEAIWLSLEQYPKIVNHPKIENLDTAGSKIFTLFTPDAPTNVEECENFKSQLQQTFQIPPETLDNLNRKLSVRTAPLQYRHEIMQSLQTRFNLVSDNPQLDSDVLRLFQCLYPGAPFEVGEVKLIKTCSALYFCLPSEVKDVPTETQNEQKSDITDRPTKKQSSKKVGYAQFLRKIWQVEPFAHFPVFGTFDAEDLGIKFREQIAKDAGLSVELVTITLTRMVGVLPLEELDKYLIHDTWGHQWQESLLDFEDLYIELSLFNRPLSLTESASVLGEQTTFAEAFVKTSTDEIHLDTEKLTEFIDAELYERSIIAFTPILAEMLADVVEYKFLMLHPEQAHLMPSSSLLKTFPSKLDLTLEDLHNCFKCASEAFQTWVDSDEAKHRIHTEICEKLEIPDKEKKHQELDHVLEKAVQLCKERLDRFYQPEWYWEKTSDGYLKLNAFSFTALNFLRIHTAFLQTYETLSEIEAKYGFKDALVLAMGTFFEMEPQQNIWSLDRFLTEGFLPRWKKLVEAS